MKAKKTHTIKFWKSPISSRWYWRAMAANGQVVADGGEGYVRRIDARAAVRNFLDAVKAGRVEVK
jgi:uncharacterized protein YegP (UPF0339 family)